MRQNLSCVLKAEAKKERKFSTNLLNASSLSSAKIFLSRQPIGEYIHLIVIQNEFNPSQLWKY